MCRAQIAPSPTPSAGTINPSASMAAQIEGKPRAKRRFPLLGVDLELARLLSAKTRSRFGGSAIGIGPGIGDIDASLNGDLSPDVSLISSSRTVAGSRNRLFVVSAGPQYRRAYVPPGILRRIKEARRRAQEAAASGAPPTGAPTGPPADLSFGPPSLVPYYGASLDALYASVKVPADGLNSSGFGGGGSVFIGIVAKSRFFVEGRVRATTSVKSYNFSRAGLTFGLRF